jgi:SAM-dependent methyltransferase
MGDDAVSARDPAARFSDRVENYVKFRPGYPPEVLDVLRRETGLHPAHAVADLGSGTGISAGLFLRAGHTVYAVEPNREMREAAEALLRGTRGFHSVAGSAEATTLASASVDYVVAAQAFHWFDAPAARKEAARILRPGGWAVLLWNARRLDATPFLRDYEALLQEFGTDYREVRHENVGADRLAAFFGGAYERQTLPSGQRFGLDGLRGRLLSSSYTPPPDDPRHAPMLRALERIFHAHAAAGEVRFEYDTQVYFGCVAGGAG